MKKIFSSILFIAASVIMFGQPVVYLDFVTHNEETGQWNNSGYYSNNRNKLITLSNYFQNNGITWNMQSDWVYLSNVLGEDSATMSNTGNKNILRWMFEDKGVEMDPHGHETQYIYPDLVKLMDSIGLPESKLMGGTLHNQSNGINPWTNLINGQNGLVFPDKFWQPDYMMGGGTPNHVNDLKYYGFWNPKDTINYLTHEPANHLRHIGVGCELKIKDTTTVAEIIDAINDLIQKVQSGQYPWNGFYIQTIFFEQGDLNNNFFYNKVIIIADSLNSIVATGLAQWKTLKQAYYLWETSHNAQIFQLECGDVSNNIPKNSLENSSVIYPNPFNSSTTLKITNGVYSECVLNIFDIFGREVKSFNISNQKTEIERGDLVNGIYFYKIKNNNNFIASGKIVIQ